MELQGMSLSEVNEHEPCFIVKSRTSKIYIPKLMPLMKKGTTATANATIRVTLENDASCKPSFSKKIKTKSYITAKMYDKASYHITGDPRLYMKAGDRYVCDVINKNPTKIYLDDKKM